MTWFISFFRHVNVFFFYQRENIVKIFEFRRYLFRDVVEILDKRRFNVNVHSMINFVWLYDYNIHEIVIFQFVCKFVDEVYLKSLFREFVSSIQSCVIELRFNVIQFKHAQYHVDIVVFVDCVKDCFENALLFSIVEQTTFYQVDVVTMHKFLFHVWWFWKIIDNEHHV